MTLQRVPKRLYGDFLEKTLFLSNKSMFLKAFQPVARLLPRDRAADNTAIPWAKPSECIVLYTAILSLQLRIFINKPQASPQGYCKARRRKLFLFFNLFLTIHKTVIGAISRRFLFNQVHMRSTRLFEVL